MECDSEMSTNEETDGAQIEVIDESRGSATLHLRLDMVKHMRDRRFGGLYIVRNLPWRIMAQVSTDQSKKYLGYFIRCEPRFDSGEESDTEDEDENSGKGKDYVPWSCRASAEMRILSHKTNFIRKVDHVFCDKEIDWGFSQFIEWRLLLDSANGYYNRLSNSVTLEVFLEAEYPCGVADFFVYESPSKFSKPWKYGDVVFVAENQKIYANKTTLCQWSEVFETMFDERFKESRGGEIPLPGKKFVDVCLFMEIIHPAKDQRTIDVSTVRRVLPLMHEYHIEPYIKICEEVLLKERPSPEKLFFADLYQLPKLEEHCITHLMAVPLFKIKECGYFDRISPAVQNRILANKVEMYESMMNAGEKLILQEEKLSRSTQDKLRKRVCETCRLRLRNTQNLFRAPYSYKSSLCTECHKLVTNTHLKKLNRALLEAYKNQPRDLDNYS